AVCTKFAAFRTELENFVPLFNPVNFAYLGVYSIVHNKKLLCVRTLRPDITEQIVCRFIILNHHIINILGLASLISSICNAEITVKSENQPCSLKLNCKLFADSLTNKVSRPLIHISIPCIISF